MRFKFEGVLRRQMALAAVVACFGAAIPASRADLPLADISTTHFQLGPYIKGSADQVRDLINGPVESLLAKRADLIQQQETIRATEAEKTAVQLRQTSPAFVKAEADLAAAQEAADAARAGDDGAARIAAQQRLTAAKANVQRQLAAAPKDPSVASDREAIAALQRRVAAMTTPIADAMRGRARTLDGFRTSAELPGPPNDGAKGFLKQIKIVKVIDAHSFAGEYVAIEKLGEDKDAKVADGQKAFKGKGYRTRLLVTDTDTAKLHEHTTVDIDRTYELAGTQKVGNVTCQVAKPVANQKLDALFAMLDDIRDPALPVTASAR